MKLLAIANPRAGHGRAARQMPGVLELCRDLDIDLDVLTTESPGHGAELTAAADLEAYDGILAAGGDGTVFEVVNGYFRNPAREGVPFGVLPIGTGNAFGRDIGLTTNGCTEALEIVARNQPRPVDVGRFSCPGGVYHYLNILGLGFVSDVTATAHRLKLLGNISYTLGVLYQTVFLDAARLSIDIDGTTLEREAIFVEVSNTRFTANFLIAPDASIEDGLLDVVLLNRVNRRRLLRCLPTVFTGEHVHLDEVETFQARRISISPEAPKLLSPDGELLGTTPVEIECLPGALPVFQNPAA